MNAKEIAIKLEANLIEPDEGIKFIKEYAKIKCKEQREICANNITKISVEHSVSWVREAVKKAPQPEFE